MMVYDGYSWHEINDRPLEFCGYCYNPECVDSEADQVERKKYLLPTGCYIEASIKTATCPKCGKMVALT